MKKLVLAAIMVLFLALPAWATLVVQLGKGVLYVKMDASSNFAWSTATFTTGTYSGQKVSTIFPNGLALTAIKYAAPSAGAVGVVRSGSATGVILTQMTSVDGGTLKDYYYDNFLYTPYITSADQTTPTNAQFWFEFSNVPQ